MHSGVPQLRAAQGQMQETCAAGAGPEGLKTILCAMLQEHASSYGPLPERGSARVGFGLASHLFQPAAGLRMPEDSR